MKKIVVLAGLAWFALTGRADAGDKYYVLIFGAQRPVVNLPQHTHSWATFVKASEIGPGRLHLKCVSVSWLPATLQIRVLALIGEEGINLNMHESLSWCEKHHLRVSLWGPYEIDGGFFEAAYARAAQLNSGVLRCKAVDFGSPARRSTNCIHAAAEAAPRPEPLRTGILTWGDTASYHIALHFSLSSTIRAERTTGSFPASASTATRRRPRSRRQSGA